MGGRGVVEEGRYRRGGGGGEVDDKTSSPSCASILGLKPAMSLITPIPSGRTFYTYALCTVIY